MNSLTLKESGFSQPCSLKTISFSSLPSFGGNVFAIIDTSITGKEETDILYIGRSKKLARRILGGYLAGYGGKNTKKISGSLLGDGFIEKTAITWVSCDKPKTMQKELLDKHVQEHGKAPLWNASGKKLEKIKKIVTAKTKSSAAASNKTAKTEKKPIAKRKVKALIKPASTKSTIPSKVTIPPKSTEPSSSHTSTDSAQKPA
jgi:hypothetical protein